MEKSKKGEKESTNKAQFRSMVERAGRALIVRCSLNHQHNQPGLRRFLYTTNTLSPDCTVFIVRIVRETDHQNHLNHARQTMWVTDEVGDGRNGRRTKWAKGEMGDGRNGRRTKWATDEVGRRTDKVRLPRRTKWATDEVDMSRCWGASWAP